MTEPTPLSDCETQVYYGYSCGIVAEQAATIDAQATEIAALKGALQLIADGDCDFENGHDNIDDCAVAIARRVLAGKEAQGG